MSWVMLRCRHCAQDRSERGAFGEIDTVVMAYLLEREADCRGEYLGGADRANRGT